MLVMEHSSIGHGLGMGVWTVHSECRALLSPIFKEKKKHLHKDPRLLLGAAQVGMHKEMRNQSLQPCVGFGRD